MSAQPSPTQPRPSNPSPVKVTVTDVDVSFWQLVWLLVKLAIAAIPALIILGALGLMVTGLLMVALGVR